MPNLTFDSLELVPDGLREYAKNTDGKFIVDVVPGVKLAEFRDNNVALSKQRDDMAGILGKLKPHIGDDIDAFVTRFGELTTVASQVKDGKLKTTDAIDTEVNNRVETMRAGYDTQIATLSAERAASDLRAAAADQRLNRSIVERGVTDAVISEKSGANPGALPDILSRAYNVFHVNDQGKLIAKEGEATIYGADGATPMTPMEWMAKLRDQAPYLFKGSNGGGAAGNTGSGYAGTGMSQEAFHALSPQAKMKLAHEMKARK